MPVISSFVLVEEDETQTGALKACRQVVKVGSAVVPDPSFKRREPGLRLLLSLLHREMAKTSGANLSQRCNIVEISILKAHKIHFDHGHNTCLYSALKVVPPS